MRLGGPLIQKYENPDQWVAAVRALGYRAAYCPVGMDVPEDSIRAYSSAAAKADIVIAEVGAWSNPLGPDIATRTAALEKCKKALALADAIGARCCVNIAGSRGSKWDGPDERDLTAETFGLIVDSVRDIIDSVRPKRTFYTLEPMPWMYPDSAQAYLDLLKAIDRKAFAVHFDPVNLICSPQRYFGNSEIIRDFTARLGPHIKSCHAKDILLQDRLTAHLDEVRPGCGKLDYRTYLAEIAKLPGDIPVMLEHLPSAEEYAAAANHIRQIAKMEGLDL
ncbi:MAG: sugar phosphate isomerase/epimerase [Planctomycetes bacterium]|nr:sugar phosphate isomerase/epimerase [Planctomycetota bacterium]